MEQPFIVGKPVSGKYFINRKNEIKKITSLLSGVIKRNVNNVILLGLRRTGKSSLLLNVEKELRKKKKKSIVVTFDAYGISTKERFAKTYMELILNSYIEQSGDSAYRIRVRKALSQGYDALKNRISEFDVTLAEFITFQTKFRESKVDEDELIEFALNYPEKLAKDKKTSFVIMLDEFQDLLKWGDDFVKTLRKIVQSQNSTTYAFCGSAPTILKDLVYTKRSPFYKQLTEIDVGKLDKKSVTSFIKRRLKTVKINIDSKALELAYSCTEGFPDYVQRLGLELYLKSLETSNKSITEKEIEISYKSMLGSLDPDFSTSLASYSDLEKDILIALSMNFEGPAEIAREIRKKRTDIFKTLDRLVAQDIVEKPRSGKYRIADPIFSDWIQDRYSPLSS